MLRTVYSTMASEDLVEFALQRDNVTQMEIELAQRLHIALGMLEEEEDGADAGRQSQSSGKKAAG